MSRKIKKKVGNQYMSSHVVFLREGDEFRTFFADGTDVDLVAMSDPYFDKKAKEWVVDIDNSEIEDIIA
jgi:hypothetical protein